MHVHSHSFPPQNRFFPLKLKYYYSNANDKGASSALFIESFANSIISIAKENRCNNDVDDIATEDTKNTTKTTLITAEHILQCISNNGQNGSCSDYDFIRDTVSSIVTNEANSSKQTKITKKGESGDRSNKATKNKAGVKLIVQVPNYLQLQKDKCSSDTASASKRRKRKTSTNTNNNKNVKMKNTQVPVSNDILLEQYLNCNELNKKQKNDSNDVSQRFYDDDEIVEDEEDYD